MGVIFILQMKELKQEWLNDLTKVTQLEFESSNTWFQSLFAFYVCNYLARFISFLGLSPLYTEQFEVVFFVCFS